MDLEAAHALDEIAFEVIAGSHQETVAGWRCKAAPDLPFRRANVALPPPSADHGRATFDTALDQVEAWYRALGVPLRVHVSAADPASERVDGWLAERGLVVEAPVHVLVAARPLAEAAVAPPGATLETTLGPDASWATEHRLDGADDRQHERATAYGRLLAPRGDHAIAVAARIDGVVAGIGFGAVHRRMLGTFGMATSPRWRRRGIASAIVAAIEVAGRTQGAEGAYLQVEVDNDAAIACYRALDYERSHGYHYRRAIEAR